MVRARRTVVLSEEIQLDWADREEGEVMTKIIGVLLIVAGTLGLIYGGFTYTKEKHDLKVGSLKFSVAQKETVNVPVWAGAGAIAIGVVLLLIGRKR
jgi:TRAP-type C4-dicarboxylate transport system permease small subunit